mmetsp:Transcript_9844/g.19224  ORF Transcript_9844/g.19224 Transcript_9844/m.19224 type:complete len:119 (-) Transcript_9844:260-616(-)
MPPVFAPPPPPPPPPERLETVPPVLFPDLLGVAADEPPAGRLLTAVDPDLLCIASSLSASALQEARPQQPQASQETGLAGLFPGALEAAAAAAAVRILVAFGATTLMMPLESSSPQQL